MLIGKQAFEKIQNAHVAVFGIGGVGSYAAETIARCGMGKIDLFDGDIVDSTNINRQVIADHETIGKPKVEVMKDRILKINPAAKINANFVFFDCSNASNYDFSAYDYIIDAIDTVSSKILLICKAKSEGAKIISCMGTGNKLNPCDFEVGDIFETEDCALARVMRRELRKRKIDNLKVVYSKEKSKYIPETTEKNGKRVNSSIAFVPPVAGMILASEVVKDIMGYGTEEV